MVDWAYVSGMPDDSGQNLDHERFDPAMADGPLSSDFTCRNEVKLPDRNGVTCRYCGQSGFHWKQTAHGWRLEDAQGQLHHCEKYHKPYDRKELVQRLRMEGAEAARAGRHINTCPYTAMDGYQWRNGFQAEYDRMNHSDY